MEKNSQNDLEQHGEISVTALAENSGLPLVRLRELLLDQYLRSGIAEDTVRTDELLEAVLENPSANRPMLASARGRVIERIGQIELRVVGPPKRYLLLRPDKSFKHYDNEKLARNAAQSDTRYRKRGQIGKAAARVWLNRDELNTLVASLSDTPQNALLRTKLLKAANRAVFTRQ